MDWYEVVYKAPSTRKLLLFPCDFCLTHPSSICMDCPSLIGGLPLHLESCQALRFQAHAPNGHLLAQLSCRIHAPDMMHEIVFIAELWI